MTAPPQRYRKSENVQKTLLDAAEALFARWGYAAVSIRDVTSLAEMRVANVSYFFGSKQNLYYEVLRRRAEPLAELRLKRLSAARKAPLSREAKLAALVDAYADPPLELSQSGEPGWKNFFSLIGQITFSGFAAPGIARFFNEPARELMRGLQDLYPDAPRSHVQAAALLLIGPYIMVIGETGRIETFDERAFSSGDLGLLGPLMKQFIVGGVRSLLEAPNQEKVADDAARKPRARAARAP